MPLSPAAALVAKNRQSLLGVFVLKSGWRLGKRMKVHVCIHTPTVGCTYVHAIWEFEWITPFLFLLPIFF